MTRSRAIISIVMRGLDPRIHQFAKACWIAGQARQRQLQ
jgi:hypothetical protein